MLSVRESTGLGMSEANLLKETKGPTCCTVIGGRILHYSCLPSTNEKALEHGAAGVSEGLVIVAEEQSEGRGRHGRNWYSPGGTGLYFSILLRPRCPQERLSLLPVAAGIGVAGGLEKLGVGDVGIKWPNDVQISGRKVAGILVESRQAADGMFAVAGVGLNVAGREFPPELADTATSLLLATGTEHSNEEVLSLMLGEIERFYSDLCLGRNDELVSRLRRFDVLRGRRVRVNAGKALTGRALGIDDEGRLIVQTEDGQEHFINSGEVELVRLAASGE
jgi:BirA family biotin operon repressor/biotin-[acetyl-CoA-carboxylase] ligase